MVLHFIEFCLLNIDCNHCDSIRLTKVLFSFDLSYADKMMLPADPRFEREDFRHCCSHIRYILGALLAIDLVLAGAVLGLSFATKSWFYVGVPALDMIAVGCGKSDAFL